jgi:flagellar operon protein (TIGR03826 family)
MPEVRNCKRCGKIYNYIGGAPICPVCKDLDEADFSKVKEYLYQNPGATLSEVSTLLDIIVDRIKHYLREGRLEIIGSDSNMILECESCGRPINSGRYCADCSRDLEKDLKSTAKAIGSMLPHSDKNKTGIGMRYLNKEGEIRKV